MATKDADMSDLEAAFIGRLEQDFLRCVWKDEAHTLQLIPGASSLTTDILLFLCLDWPRGLEIVLNSPMGKHANLVTRCFHEAGAAGDVECAIVLTRYLGAIDAHDLQVTVVRQQEAVREAIISALAERRQRLKDFALFALPSNSTQRPLLTSNGLPDICAGTLYDALENQGTTPNGDLRPFDSSVYAHICHDISTAARLYRAGFTDLNQRGYGQISPLIAISVHGTLVPHFDILALIRLAAWMVSKGGRPDLRDASQCNALHHLGRALGGGVAYWCSVSSNPNAQANLIENITSLDRNSDLLLGRLLRDRTLDGCSCACSDGGCSPLITMFKSIGACPRDFIEFDSVQQECNIVVCILRIITILSAHVRPSARLIANL